MSTGKPLMLTASSHLKTTHQQCIKALLLMNSNALDVAVTTLDRSLYTRIKEHSCHDSSEIYNHICSCNEFNFIKNMLELSPYDEDSNIKCSLTDLISTNTKIIDKSKHCSLILFQDSIAINRLKSSTMELKLQKIY